MRIPLALGALIKAELESAFTLLDDYGSDRVLWMLGASEQGSVGNRSKLIICAYYCAPGGDIHFLPI